MLKKNLDLNKIRLKKCKVNMNKLSSQIIS